MPIEIGSRIKFFMGPESVDPSLDDLEAAIVDFIDGAEKKLEIAVQELESRPIAEALLRAEIERKVQVRIVLEADYLVASKRPKTVAEAFESKGPQEENRLLAAAALRSTVWLRSDFNPDIFHQKFIVRDGSAVLTGSTNFTPTGVGKSKKGGNLNHILIVEDREFARIYAREFREIANGDFGRDVADRNEHPPEVVVEGVRLKVCFAPDHNPEMEIAKRINKARKRIDFAIFTFSKSSALDDAMAMALFAGVPVTGVMDGMQANQKWAATQALIEAGATLKQVRRGGGVNKLHHKLMVVDDETMVIGSMNYTGPANLVNDENIVVIMSDDASDAAGPMIRAARTEIERIAREHGSEFQPVGA